MKQVFYKDGILNVSLKRIKGDYATLHKIIVYRYEGEEEIVAQISKNELEKGVLTQSFRIYPTFVKDKISIDFEMPIAKQNSISIYDIMGRKIESIMIPENTKTFIINLEKIPKGIYFIKLENENKIYRIVKIK
jgi:hypothetical protein